MPYVLTNLTDGQVPGGVRAVSSGYVAGPGEVLVSDAAYQSKPGGVWDAATQSLRMPNAAEILERTRARKELELHDAANAEFLDSEQVFQGVIVGCLWAHNTALNATEQAIFDSMNARYTKLKNKITYVRGAARTQAELDALSWTSTP